MIILKVDYIRPMADVERYLAEHRAYLDELNQRGTLIASGPQNPRTGGVIILNAPGSKEAREIVEGDPFHRHGIANYTIIEFKATKHNAANFAAACE